MLPSRESFHPTGRRMWDLLKDGQFHSRHDLHACCEDELSAMNVVAVHIKDMRKVLRPKGYDIECASRREDGICYRLIRTLSTNSE